MITVLVDHDIEGQALALWGTLGKTGWLEIVDIELITFQDVGLPFDSSDRKVWRFAQANGMILLTNNRNMDGDDSLEQTLRDENKLASLPVLTIANANRLSERLYRERCATQILEIVIDLDTNLGRSRIYIPYK